MGYAFVNGAQLLNAALVSAVPPLAVMSPVTRIYASEKSQILDLITFVSNLIIEPFSSPSPYSALFWSMITSHFIVANFEDYYHHVIDLQSLQFLFLYMIKIKQWLQNFAQTQKLLLFATVVLSAILFPIKSPVVSAVFWATLLEPFFTATLPVFVQYPSIFYNIYHFYHFCSKWQKAISFNVFSVFWFYWISHFYKIEPIIGVTFTLSSICSGLLFWSINHNSIDSNFALVVFTIVNEWGEIGIHGPNCLLRTKVNKIPQWWKTLLLLHFFQAFQWN